MSNSSCMSSFGGYYTHTHTHTHTHIPVSISNRGTMIFSLAKRGHCVFPLTTGNCGDTLCVRLRTHNLCMTFQRWNRGPNPVHIIFSLFFSNKPLYARVGHLQLLFARIHKIVGPSSFAMLSLGPECGVSENVLVWTVLTNTHTHTHTHTHTQHTHTHIHTSYVPLNSSCIWKNAPHSHQAGSDPGLMEISPETLAMWQTLNMKTIAGPQCMKPVMLEAKTAIKYSRQNIYDSVAVSPSNRQKQYVQIRMMKSSAWCMCIGHNMLWYPPPCIFLSIYVS